MDNKTVDLYFFYELTEENQSYTMTDEYCAGPAPDPQGQKAISISTMDLPDSLGKIWVHVWL